MSAFGQAHDPLDDMELSAERQLFYKIKAAVSLILRSSRPAEQILKMYQITVSEWFHFLRKHPQEAEKLKAANAVFFLPSFCPFKFFSAPPPYPRSRGFFIPW
jgi:hypothetical protein